MGESRVMHNRAFEPDAIPRRRAAWRAAQRER
jgi:hypothetical protein